MVELDEAHNMKVILKKHHNRNKVVYNRTEHVPESIVTLTVEATFCELEKSSCRPSIDGFLFRFCDGQAPFFPAPAGIL